MMQTFLYLSKARPIHIVILVAVFLTSSFGRANVIFEGYYKILLSDVHSGYAIQRYELDPKKKEFKSTSYLYLKTSPDGSQSSAESLTAISDEGFKPKSYQYTALINGKATTIDASFKNNNLIANVRNGSQTNKKTTLLPQGGFLSTMLLYMVLQKGLKTGAGYSYNAVAEEDGQVYPGSLKVEKETQYKGKQVFQLDYDFKNIKSMAYVAQNGDVLFTDSKAQRVNTELVSSPSDARLTFPFPQKTIQRLFNGIPTGQINFLAGQKSSSK